MGNRNSCLAATIVACIILATSLVFSQDMVNTSRAATYRYSRIGNKLDISTTTKGGVALLGGGIDPEAAYLWLCNKSGGGDFLILAAAPESSPFNWQINNSCDENSVATLIVPSREAADDPFVAATIRNAEAIYIGGGIQGDDVKFWQGTPVQAALNEQIRRGVPIAGMSAGLSLLGEYNYTGAYADSGKTLNDPYNDRVVITHDFLRIPELRDIITDTHLRTRNRLGRLLVFLARIQQDGLSQSVRGIGVDEGSAVLIEPDGSAAVVGVGNGAYFVNTKDAPVICKPGEPLTYHHIHVQRVTPGNYFNLDAWSGSRVTEYELNVDNGKLSSDAPLGY